MKVRALLSMFAVCLLAVGLLYAKLAIAQAPGRAGAAAPAGAPQVHANLAQLMRGILFPNANVLFAIQTQDPAAVKPDADPSMAINPLAGAYGGWQAVENSGLALAEAATLLTFPGRMCANGKPVPVQNADWTQFVQELREAGLAVYKAAQAKDKDEIVNASDTLTLACADCHDVYRDKSPAQGGDAARCLP